MELPKKVKTIITKFEQAGGEIWVVGGAVRDMLLGRKVKDWDFATNLTPEEMKKVFVKNSFYNNQFGTFSIVKNGEIFEVTTFRSEKGYKDKRHPDKVSWGKRIEDDLKRRDFTVNAIAWQSSGQQLIDLFGGQEDLKNKLIRAVGKAEDRFDEDALRMMRAVRLAAQLDFDIEEKTKRAIKKQANLINRVAAERIRDELFKILLSPAPAWGMDLLGQTGLLEQIMPELLAGVKMEQKGHHVYDVWTHNLKTLQNCRSKNPVTRLACLLHDVAKPKVLAEKEGERTFHNHEVVGARMAVEIGKRLRLSKQQLVLLFKLVRWHMFSASEKQTDKAIRRLIRRVTPEYLDEMIALRRADRLGSGAKETSWRWELFKKRLVEVQKQPFTVKDLKVDGKDVMQILGIKPGPRVGEVLNQLFAEVETNPKLNKRKILLKKIEETAV